MVSYDKNFQAKFEVTMSFIVMSYYYVDNLLSKKNARALAHVAWGPFLESPGKLTGPVITGSFEKRGPWFLIILQCSKKQPGSEDLCYQA